MHKFAITAARFQRYVGRDDRGDLLLLRLRWNQGEDDLSDAEHDEDLYNYAVPPALLSLPLPLPQHSARVRVPVKAREGYSPQYNRASPY